MTETRKLAAILAADVVGFSRLAGADEATWRRLSKCRKSPSDQRMAANSGPMPLMSSNIAAGMHWTGHKSRLDRDLRHRFGERAYAAEELIAELGAAFLSAEFGFDGEVRNAGYIQSWIGLLKADKRAFFTACSKASKAADYLRGLALAQPAEIAA